MDPRALLEAIRHDPQNTLGDIAWWEETLTASIRRASLAEAARASLVSAT